MARVTRDFWLVQVGEELPCDPGSPRLLRTALLAEELTRRGHRVTFWNSTFNHTQKRQRNAVEDGFNRDGSYKVILLNGRSYEKNVSIARILSHQDNARAFIEQAPRETQPAAIVCGYPTIELADAVSAYAQSRNVPLAIDCRDMWPDVIESQAPVAVRALAVPIFMGWRRAKRRALGRATGITGITEAFVDWGLRAAGRPRRATDRCFHLAIAPTKFAPEALAAANAYWDACLGPASDDVKVLCFGGTLSRRLDLAAFIEGALAMDPSDAARIRIVLCGKGDLQEKFQMQIAATSHLFLAGWRSPAELRALMDRSVLGILPYPNTDDFLASFPNKVGEYLSAGLPILTGLKGVTGELLSTRNLLEPYVTGDPADITSVLTKIARRSPDDADPSRQQRARAAFHELFDPAQIYPAFADYMEEISPWPGAHPTASVAS